MEATREEFQSEGAATPPVEVDEEEIIIAKAQGLMIKITSDPDNPKPRYLHTLAFALEYLEARYMRETGSTSLNNGRASHRTGRLGNVLRDNTEFFKLISVKFLSETRYSISVQAATVRLLFSCSLTWTRSHLFGETVLNNLKGWALDEPASSFTQDPERKMGSGVRQSSDLEMLKTYSTGLLAVCLDGGQLGEDVPTSSSSTKLMRYLQIHVLGESSTSEKESNHLLDNQSSLREDEHRSNHEFGSSRDLLESKPMPDIKGSSGRIDAHAVILERDDSNDCFQHCKIGSRDISDLVKMVLRAAEAEARSVNASVGAIKAAGDAAAELVKTAALEEFGKTNDEEAAVLCASQVASTVVNAIEVCSEEVRGLYIPDSEFLARLRVKFCIQCLDSSGQYISILGPVLREKGVDVCISLLQRYSDLQEASKSPKLLPNVLKFICSLLAHREFAALFVDCGGIQKLLALPRVPLTFVGVSSCLLAIVSPLLQGIIERVCALPSDVIHQLISLALQLLECNQDQARKNTALFFAAAFVFRPVLDAFDDQVGLQKLLNILREAASVRSGVSSGTGSSTSGPLRNEREVLTSAEKQMAYHTTVALNRYFKAHLILLLDSLCPSKNIPSSKEANKPLDISNEAIDVICRQIQNDRLLGHAFVRAHWPAVDKFLKCNGHITMLELCQDPPAERYSYDLLRYALGVLHIVTLLPYSRELVVGAPLSNGRQGIAVILDAANVAGFVKPVNGGNDLVAHIIQQALSVLVNLVCPPPSIGSKPAMPAQVQMPSSQPSNARSTEAAVKTASLTEPREQNRDSSLVVGTSFTTSGSVGDHRISVGADIQKSFHQLRVAVRANNGIKVLLQLLRPTIIIPSTALDCLRALACRVLLGLATDDTIAHILTELQVGKKLSEFIQDSGSTPGKIPYGEEGSWQTELSQVALELIAIVTKVGRTSTLAATPTLQRIERAVIASATPITYRSEELLLLIFEHLQASGLSAAASALMKEAQLTPLQSLAAPASLAYQTSGLENSPVKTQWPSGRSNLGFNQLDSKRPSDVSFTSGVGSKTTSYSHEHPSPSGGRINDSSKRKSTELRDDGPSLSSKRLHTNEPGLPSPLCPTPNTSRENCLPGGGISDGLDDSQNTQNHLGSQFTSKRLTLDAIIVGHLEHQHSQCLAPITTLPPLSLLHPHICPESKRNLGAPSNITSRLITREFRNMNGSHRDCQFVYSRFRPWRMCKDDTVFSCITFLGDSSQIATGSNNGLVNVFESNSNNVLESSPGHQFPLTMVKSFVSGDTRLLLSSSSHNVMLWDVPLVSTGPKYSFDGIKAATFSHCGAMFAALPCEISSREVLLYDVQTCKSDLKLMDQSSNPSNKGLAYSQVHFSPSDFMLLFNGVLWDRRVPGPVHRFEQYTDYGSGGFHPAGNEVIINSEVWDIRNFRLLCRVPSLDQTKITFNARGDVIYAILRRNLEQFTSAFQTRRAKHPLFSAFRTLDAANYSDIATVPVGSCVLDFATEPTDSAVGLVTLDNPGGKSSSARLYEIGKRTPKEGDSDPDNAESEEEEEEVEEEDEALLENDDTSIDDDGLSDLEGDDGDRDDDDDDDDMMMN